ncbi:FkbM family methyltransferase, partial [Pseudomonas aeruginosa]|nr:FkbM family methyltransferase [Pseudomonas aeruginosa]EKV7629267.1 FkbM family methyltransferase [Pseudomonas aeruginosa]EKX2223048.1 FkbM family methyltransferase [Pseudomonas aeruginosa]ELH6356556.1 FkbM family methyltransferase [Pseudomonas aeruginosa]ELO3576455.1 FkbM family methyltransferase [Pseudomonas aeruginosa]
MPFVSYAQNLEDVRLCRALKLFPRGFYIDVGANHPRIDSVTLAFYERGWRGINIEPLPHLHRELERERPEDLNLNLAIGEREGRATLYEMAASGLSTLDPELARQRQAEGCTATPREVKVSTLDAICAAHVEGPIHFLKIDVEGLEGAVLRGLDLNRWRPWLILAETPFDHDPEWKAPLLAAGYRFVHFDGLNGYYLAEEQARLEGAFALPPNLLDDFQLCHGHAMSHPVAPLEQALEQALQRAEDAERALRDWRALPWYRRL